MDLTKKLSVLVFLVCVLIALWNQRAAPDSPSSAPRRNLEGHEPSPHSDGGEEEDERLAYDFYGSSCPSAEEIVRTTVRELHSLNSSHVLLDSAGDMKSEKLEIPNMSLRGFEEIDAIKSRLEQECPAVVSCADIVALAARESVLLAGGQYYPVFTGRTDSRKASPEEAASDLPGPDFELALALRLFSDKGFDARETIALLGGGHSTGRIHCNFIQDRIFNFKKKKGAHDPAINSEFLEILKSECSHPAASTPSPSSAEMASFENRAFPMDYEGAGNGFGDVYFRSLLQGKGLLFVDQQLMLRDDTKAWVETYASNLPKFRRDFGLAMFKLTHLLGSEDGEVRLNCNRINKVV